jgi:hypothetical protein
MSLVTTKFGAKLNAPSVVSAKLANIGKCDVRTYVAYVEAGKLLASDREYFKVNKKSLQENVTEYAERALNLSKAHANKYAQLGTFFCDRGLEEALPDATTAAQNFLDSVAKGEFPKSIDGFILFLSGKEKKVTERAEDILTVRVKADGSFVFGGTAAEGIDQGALAAAIASMFKA